MNDVAVHGFSFRGDDVSEGSQGGRGSAAGGFAVLTNDELSDSVLVARARAGDEAAFAGLYERHAPSVTRVCRRWLGDDDLVEDAVQDTFVKIWGALGTFSGGERFGRWARRIAKNHCHSLHRAWQRRGREVASEVVVDLPDPGPPVDAVDGLAVQRMLASLEPRDAALLVGRHVGELSVSALAARWGLTNGSMDVALHRARARARRFATAEGLRGLFPVPLLRRMTAWCQRAWTSWTEAVVAVAETAAPLIVAAGLALPGAAAASPDPAEVAPHRPIAAQPQARGGSAHARPEPAWQSAGARATAHDTLRVARTERDPDAIDGKAQPRYERWRHAPAFEPVPVPGTNRELRQTPPPDHKPSHNVGVNVSVVPEVETSEDRPEQRVIREACPAIDATPATYCTSHP